MKMAATRPPFLFLKHRNAQLPERALRNFSNPPRFEGRQLF
jgi:hypothetical protein